MRMAVELVFYKLQSVQSKSISQSLPFLRPTKYSYKSRGLRFQRNSADVLVLFFRNVKYLCKRDGISLVEMKRRLASQGITIHHRRVSDYISGRQINATIVYLMIYANFFEESISDMLSIDYSLLGSDSAQI